MVPKSGKNTKNDSIWNFFYKSPVHWVNSIYTEWVFTRWVENFTKLTNCDNKRSSRRLISTKDVSISPQMELQLFEWFTELRKQDSYEDGDDLRAKAVSIYRQIHTENSPENSSLICSKAWQPFFASTGWLKNFFNRKRLSYRRITTTGRYLPLDSLKRINDFFLEVNN